MIESIIQKMIEGAVQTACKAIESRLKALEGRIDTLEAGIQDIEGTLNSFDSIDEYELRDSIYELECDLEKRFVARDDIPNDLGDLNDLTDRILHIENYLLKVFKGFDK